MDNTDGLVWNILRWEWASISVYNSCNFREREGSSWRARVFSVWTIKMSRTRQQILRTLHASKVGRGFSKVRCSFSAGNFVYDLVSYSSSAMMTRICNDRVWLQSLGSVSAYFFFLHVRLCKCTNKWLNYFFQIKINLLVFPYEKVTP